MGVRSRWVPHSPKPSTFPFGYGASRPAGAATELVVVIGGVGDIELDTRR